MDKADNARISKNLEITKPALKAIQKYFNKFILSEWDYKIDNLNALSRDDSLKPLERAQTAIRKFDRLGVSEIMTPEKIADDMVALFPEDELKRIAQSGEKILDIASKAGEFAIALYKRYKKIDPNIDVSDLILSIPTSSHAYEFTRNVYAALGLNLDNIAEKFTSYDLLEVKKSNGEIDYDRIKLLLTQKKAFRKITMNDKVSTRVKHFTIAGVIGNPPYQKDDGGNGDSASPIYDKYVYAAQSATSRNVCMIMPARWYTGGKGLDDFRDKMLADKRICYLRDYVNSKDCFPGMSVSGGICYLRWDGAYDGGCDYVESCATTNEYEKRSLSEFPVFVRYNAALSVIHKTQAFNEGSIQSIMTSRNPYGIPTSARGADTIFNGAYRLISSKGAGYISKEEILVNHNIADAYKVMLTRIMNEHAGEPDKNGQLGVLATIRVLNKREVCTDSYITCGCFNTKVEAENLASYLKTRFARFLLLQAAASINLSKATYRFVPMQDFTESWTDEKLYEKYGITESEQKFIESLIKPME